MKIIAEFVKSTILGGLLVILPVVLLIIMVAKVLGMLKPVADPIAGQLPEQYRYPMIVGVLLVVVLCFGAGLLAATRVGRTVGGLIEASMLNRIPGYSTVRSLTRRVVNEEEDSRKFAPCFAEIEDALVPAFIIEELDDGGYTIFVPSAPTPAAGTIYVLTRDRVHLVDAPFMDVIKSVSKFGVGTAELLRSMHPPGAPKALAQPRK